MYKLLAAAEAINFLLDAAIWLRGQKCYHSYCFQESLLLFKLFLD